jgi:hypothetical protein
MANYRHSFRGGLQWQASYFWSHALDTASNGGIVSFGTAPLAQIGTAGQRNLNYSNADYDARHNLTGDLIWEMPKVSKNSLAETLFGRWSLGTRLNARSGLPFSVTNTRISGNLTSFGGAVLADVTDPQVARACGPSSIDVPCFSSAQFGSALAQTDFGNWPRNSFRSHGYFNLDASLFKTIPLHERIKWILGASAFNVLNHPNFATPGSDISNPGLGLTTSTVLNQSGPLGSLRSQLSGRVVVVTAKLVF